MKAYLINTDKMRAVGRFATSADAERVAKAASYPYDIVTEAADLKRYLGKELVVLYNNHRGKHDEVKKFSDAATGRKRVLVTLEIFEFPVINSNGKAQKTYKIIEGTDFSKRRGGYRATLDAFAGGCRTPIEAWGRVKEARPTYKRSDVSTDVYLGKKHGYLEEISV